jgi:ubiquinol-cytochrome c reductase cytochrome b subunit
VIGGLVQVNPIWVYGPFDATVVSSPAQPDWYVGWLDGALRISPPFEPTILGVTIPSPFIPGVVVPGVIFTIIALWPFLEARLNREDSSQEHHLLDHIAEHPKRTANRRRDPDAFGVLTLAGGNDVAAFYFSADVETLTRLFRMLTLVLPGRRLARRAPGSASRGSDGSPPTTPRATAREAGRPTGGATAGGFDEVES